MSESVDLRSAAEAALDEVAAAFARFTGCGLDSCTDAELEALTRRWKRLRNQHAMVDVGLVGQLTSRGIPFARGCANTAAYLRYALRVSPAEARRRVVAVQRFGVVSSGSMTVGPIYALAAPAPAADGTPDPRTPGQRRHDALAELARLAMRARLMPRTAGVSTTIILHLDAEAYRTGEATAITGHGYTVPADIAKGWAENGGRSEARAIAVLLAKTRRVEAYSAVHRIFTAQQRLAMTARDFGCSFPTCDSTGLHTQAHHVREWRDGGATTTDNGIPAHSPPEDP